MWKPLFGLLCLALATLLIVLTGTTAYGQCGYDANGNWSCSNGASYSNGGLFGGRFFSDNNGWLSSPAYNYSAPTAVVYDSTPTVTYQSSPTVYSSSTSTITATGYDSDTGQVLYSDGSRLKSRNGVEVVSRQWADQQLSQLRAQLDGSTATSATAPGQADGACVCNCQCPDYSQQLKDLDAKLGRVLTALATYRDSRATGAAPQPTKTAKAPAPHQRNTQARTQPQTAKQQLAYYIAKQQRQTAQVAAQ